MCTCMHARVCTCYYQPQWGFRTGAQDAVQRGRAQGEGHGEKNRDEENVWSRYQPSHGKLQG